MTAVKMDRGVASEPSSYGSTARPLLRVRDLRVWFPIRRGLLRRTTGWIYAVDDISFDIPAGRTLGLVGESGSGKTTTGRAIVRLSVPQTGRIELDGEDLLALRRTKLRRQRRRFQMVFQDPYSSLDPRQTVRQILSEPLKVHHLPADGDRDRRIAELLKLVNLDPRFAERLPHEFSGGQRQRIGIARALAAEPELVVCDEPISALDVSVQAQVINLLQRLQGELGLTYLFIAHDLAVVRHLAHQVAVMYLGRIVEMAPVGRLFEQPRHPYTVALLSAVPVPDARIERRRQRIILAGDIPSPAAPPPGCRFHTRCWLYERLGQPDICREKDPPMSVGAVSAERASAASGESSVTPVDPSPDDHLAACHFPEESARVAPKAPTA